jgi:hypothetical protein
LSVLALITASLRVTLKLSASLDMLYDALSACEHPTMLSVNVISNIIDIIFFISVYKPPYSSLYIYLLLHVMQLNVPL